MSQSLREQLLKAGLATEKQAKQAERSASQQRYRDAKGGHPAPAPGQTPAAQQAQAAKAARDQQLNRERQLKAEAKARAAQLRELIDQHKLPRPDSDDYFNFVDGGRIRRVAVTSDLRSRLVAGSIVIVRCEGRYDLLPAEAAQRIRERDPKAIVDLAAAAECRTEPVADDPYKDFVVPDDLTW